MLLSPSSMVGVENMCTKILGFKIVPLSTLFSDSRLNPSLDSQKWGDHKFFFGEETAKIWWESGVTLAPTSHFSYLGLGPNVHFGPKVLDQ